VHIPKITLLAALIFAVTAGAEVVLPRIISDHMILQRDAQASIWGWAVPGESVTVQFAGQSKRAKADADSRWQVTLDPLVASATGRELSVTGTNTVVLKDVLVGEVWLASGQSNMASGVRQVPGDERAVYNAARTNDSIRLFLSSKTDADVHAEDTDGRWIRHSEDALHTSAVAFFFALKLQQELKVPVAYVVVARLGSKIEPFIPPEEYASLGLKQKGSSIYNSAIAPLSAYALKGAIWYQGESNRGTAEYFDCVKALQAGWSRAFGMLEMPLYQVQVAPFDHSRKGIKSSLASDTVWAGQQRAAHELTGVELVAIHDTNINVSKIHPRRKKPVGERLAALALKHQYGKDVVTAGPQVAKASRAGDRIMVDFADIASRLSTRDNKPPCCFELSADGTTFVEVNAKLVGNTVEIDASQLGAATYVRMGWYDAAIPNLQDDNGWPVFAFPGQLIKPAR
jgi:sialate O-acetylesterase